MTVGVPQRVVLAGAGHAHALLLREWARAPLPGVELMVVSPQALAPYSGMVPGWLGGAYRFEEIVVDFPALCARAGARWIAAELQALDPDRRRLRLSDGAALDFDWLSLNVGSTLRPPPGLASALPLRPLSQLHAALAQHLADWCDPAAVAPWCVTAVGGGAAGFESLLAMLARLRALRPARPLRGRLVSRGADLLPGISAPARRAAQRALARAGVELCLSTPWSDALARDSDLVLWATGAEAHDWQRTPARRGTLAVDDAGFVRIDAHLRSVSHPRVFAVGDCAHWERGAPLPKAGVYAVRMGPVLAAQLRAAITGAPAPPPYVPQRRFLALLATGDGRAIASRGPFGAAGRWAWHWKDRIDRGFLARFSDAA